VSDKFLILHALGSDRNLGLPQDDVRGKWLTNGRKRRSTTKCYPKSTTTRKIMIYPQNADAGTMDISRANAVSPAASGAIGTVPSDVRRPDTVGLRGGKMANDYYSDAANWRAWAIGKWPKSGGSFKVRRVVWGRLMARAERRPGETIVQAAIMVRMNER